MSGGTRTRTRRANVEITDTSMLPVIMQKLRELAKREVFIGMQGDEELAMIAGVHEYGSMKMGIPARSYVGIGKKRATAMISRRVKSGFQGIVEGGDNAQSLLEDIGTIGLDKIMKRFVKIKQPPLTPIYARIKGNKKILIDNKKLEESLTFVIGPKGSGGQ